MSDIWPISSAMASRCRTSRVGSPRRSGRSSRRQRPRRGLGGEDRESTRRVLKRAHLPRRADVRPAGGCPGVRRRGAGADGSQVTALDRCRQTTVQRSPSSSRRARSRIGLVIPAANPLGCAVALTSAESPIGSYPSSIGICSGSTEYRLRNTGYGVATRPAFSRLLAVFEYRFVERQARTCTVATTCPTL